MHSPGVLTDPTAGRRILGGMLLLLLGVVFGLALLTVSADQFVAGAARVSTALRVSPAVIGAVVIGFGTSAPEMVVSGIAASGGSLDIAVGNIIGSNVANLSLVLGSASLLVPIAVDQKTIRRELPLSVGSVLVFAGLVQGGLTRVEGVVLAVLMVASLAWILKGSRTPAPVPVGADEEGRAVAVDVPGGGELAELVEDPTAISTPRESLRTFLGLVGTLVAAQVLVSSAVGLADVLGLEQGFVGLTIVAIGTSLPELATSLLGVRRGETDLIIGNLLGSNLFNSFGVGAVAALVGPGLVGDAGLTTTGVALMVGVALAAALAMVRSGRVVRWHGWVLLGSYLGTLPLLA